VNGSVYTTPQMAEPIDWTMLEALRGQGAIRIAFHPSGALASVEFGPVVGDPDESQHEASDAPKGDAPTRSHVGRLVPRVQTDRQ
jgi:hypothetical protein